MIENALAQTPEENLFQKLEEKMMTLLTELEDSRKEIQRLQQENTQLKQDHSTLKMHRESDANKVRDLISLLDSVNSIDNALLTAAAPAPKPVLIQV